tara:strand:- start:110 stop:340 length:231 start_codon:yes stop_codon:yes gene_type:complete
MDKIDAKLFKQIVILDSIQKLRNIKKNIKLINSKDLIESLDNFLNILEKEEVKHDIDLFNISMGKMILTQKGFVLS